MKLTALRAGYPIKDSEVRSGERVRRDMSDGFVGGVGGRGGAVLTRMLFKAKADAVHMLVIGSRVRTAGGRRLQETTPTPLF